MSKQASNTANMIRCMSRVTLPPFCMFEARFWESVYQTSVDPGGMSARKVRSSCHTAYNSLQVEDWARCHTVRYPLASLRAPDGRQMQPPHPLSPASEYMSASCVIRPCPMCRDRQISLANEPKSTPAQKRNSRSASASSLSRALQCVLRSSST
eukprot:6568673-Pyramimonas_sp.AAC.1